MILLILGFGIAGLFTPFWQIVLTAFLGASLKNDLPVDPIWVSLLAILVAVTWGIYEAKRQDKVEKSRELGFRKIEMIKELLSNPAGLPPAMAVELFRDHYGFDISYEEIVSLAGVREQLPMIAHAARRYRP